MKSIPDGDRTLLDNSMILTGSAIADGNRHNHDDLPIILAGGPAVNQLGRYIAYPHETPLTICHDHASALEPVFKRLCASTGMLDLPRRS